MSNPIFYYELMILEKHLDTFGHVNNATYLSLYEEARWDFMNKNGMGLEQIMEQKVGPVLLDLQLTFKSELKNRQKIKISSQAHPQLKNPLVMCLDQKMIKADGRIASTLTLSVGIMDLALRKLIPPDQKWMHVLGYDQCLK